MTTTLHRQTPVLIGPGAIGGSIAGALIEAARGARDVRFREPVLVSRTPVDHLRVNHPNGVIDATVASLSDRAVAVPVDLVVLAVKAHQTESVAPWLKALTDAETLIVVLQNGVEHIERVRPFVHPDAEIVPVVVSLPAHRDGPGEIVVGGVASVTMPASDGARAFAERLQGSFVRSSVTDDWLQRAWTKLMLNSAAGGLCVFSGTSNAVFDRDQELAALACDLMREVALVGRAEGATLADDLPGTILASLVQRAGGHRSSIVQDRLSGVPIEWDARNAVVERIARRHGIDVPLNRMLATLLRVSEPDAAP